MTLISTGASAEESSAARQSHRAGGAVQDLSRGYSARTFKLVSLLLIVLGALILVLPVLVYGPYPKADDVYEHLTFDRYFSEQFWSGDLYPRWLTGINHGLGSPSFFVFPPFQAYVHSLVLPFTTLFHLDSLTVEELLIVLTSGVCAFLWMRSLFSQRIATAMALLYMLAPYHLYVDLYRRTALGECWALAWTPLLLYLTAKIMAGRRVHVVSFAITYAVLILSHLISVLMISAIPILAALLLGREQRRLRAAADVIAGMVLGTGLSFAYFLPALRNARNFPPYMLTPPVSTYLVGLQSLSSTFTGSALNRAVAFCSVNAMAVCVLCGVLVLVKGSPESKRRALFWLGISLVPGFMMCAVSQPVWGLSNKLIWSIQYPFRLNVILCLTEAALVAEFLTQRWWTSRLAWWSRIAVACLLIAPWLYSYGMVWRLYAQEPNPAKELAEHHFGRFHDDGWFVAWSARELNEEGALRASAGSPALFTSGAGKATVIAWAPRHIEVETESSTGGSVRINQFFYPAWRATLAATGEQIDTTAGPDGLLTAVVPPGKSMVRFDIPFKRSEYAGYLISALSLLLCIFLLWKNRRRSGSI